MLFNSWYFVLFFVAVLTLYHATRWRVQNMLLVAASYAFYAAWDWRFTALLAGSTAVDYVVALKLHETTKTSLRKRLVLLSLAVNLGVLGFFKYFDFFVESAVGALENLGVHANAPMLRVVLPVGISFYTFQTLAYTMDVYRKQIEPTRDFVAYALYVSYFPQLVAGPIERAARLLPQIQSPRRVTQTDWNEGAQLILWGFVKKVAVADTLAKHVDKAFSNPEAQGGLFLWLAMYCFALQIYCDFSGYTDIARGTSRLFGIRLMENFRQPYWSSNITEFWRRWHISLSTWLRDYLYIPLGGNRHGKFKRYRNLMLTMLLGGLWHGAAWTFVLWGGLHGTLLALHRFLTRDRPVAAAASNENVLGRLTYLAKIVFTFHLVTLAWIPFRAESWSQMTAYLWRLASWPREFSIADVASTGIVDNLVFYGLVVATLDYLCWSRNRELPMAPSQPAWLRGLAYGAGLVVLTYIRGAEGEPFIYFQF